MIYNIAVQLNSLQKECEADLEGTLAELSKMGYNGVEIGFRGGALDRFCGKTPNELAALLSKYRLELAGTHVRIEEMMDNFDEIVKFQKAVGGNKIIIMYGEIHGSESLSLLIDNLNAIHCRLRQHRIDLFYHNHEQEFKKYSKGEIALDEIMNRTDLLLEFDAFWAEQAGADVADVFKRYDDRIQLVHLKDGENHMCMPIGDGKASCKQAYDFAVNNDVEWVIVELCSSQPNPIEAVKKSINFIENNF